MEQKKLYKVTRTKYRREFDQKTRSYRGPWLKVTTRVGYRIREADVRLALRHAARIDERNTCFPDTACFRYVVDAEVAGYPEFSPYQAA